MMDGLTKWLKVGRVIDALKVMTVRNWWKLWSSRLKSMAPD